MKLPKLKTMTFDALLTLRDTADKLIGERAGRERRLLEERLSRLSSYSGKRTKRASPLKGRKAPVLFRNSANTKETWAGRGRRPRWLDALIAGGRKIEEFAVANMGATPKKTRRKRKKGKRVSRSIGS